MTSICNIVYIHNIEKPRREIVLPERGESRIGTCGVAQLLNSLFPQTRPAIEKLRGSPARLSVPTGRAGRSGSQSRAKYNVVIHPFFNSSLFISLPLSRTCVDRRVRVIGCRPAVATTQSLLWHEHEGYTHERNENEVARRRQKEKERSPARVDPRVTCHQLVNYPNDQDPRGAATGGFVNNWPTARERESEEGAEWRAGICV